MYSRYVRMRDPLLFILVSLLFSYSFFLEVERRCITILSAIRKITQENIICSFFRFGSDQVYELYTIGFHISFRG